MISHIKTNLLGWAIACAVALASLTSSAQPFYVDTFSNATSIQTKNTPGLEWVNFHGFNVTTAWDPSQASPGNPNPGAMHVTINWPTTNSTTWTDIQFNFSTGAGTFPSSNYGSLDCDIKVDTTNSSRASDGTYGSVELILGAPWTRLLQAPLAATNGWQHFSGGFSAIPATNYNGAVIGLISSGTGALTNPVSFWIDNIVFTPTNSPSTPTNSLTQQASILTYHNDSARSGANTNEATLTLATVNSNNFGLLFNQAVDGYVCAQPLIMTNVAIPGRGAHDVLFIATEHDSVYAFDADSNAPPLWRVSLLDSNLPSDTVPPPAKVAPSVPELGITGTPVIDQNTGTLYVVAELQEVTNGTDIIMHQLHALDVTTGQEKFGGPVIIQANVPGTGDNSANGAVSFDPMEQFNGSALLLVNGTVYITFGAPGPTAPFHGWLLGYNAQTLQQTSAFNTAPNGSQAELWMAGAGPAADASNNLYFISGAGTFSTNYASPTNDSLGGSFIKLQTTNGVALADYFRPYNETTLETQAKALGSAGLTLLPSSVGSVAHPNLLVASGGSGNVYLLDRDNLGHFNSTTDTAAVQEISAELNACYAPPAFLNGYLFLQASAAPLYQQKIANAAIGAKFKSTVAFLQGAVPTVSAKGTNNAIVWELQTDNYASGGPTVLYAYNAYNLAQELYDSSQAPLRDTAVPAVPFSSPTVVNGKVYVGGQFGVSVFGTGRFTALPTFSPSAGVMSFTNSTTVTITDTTTNATLYYTLDGSAPTTNSPIYSGPLTITNTVSVNALAVAPGSLPSSASGPVLVSSSTATNTTGSVLQAFYPGMTRAQIESPGFSAPPAYIRHLPSFSIPVAEGGNWAETLTGWFIPPVTGNYVFYVASAGDSDLFLSTDATATNAHLIAQETAESSQFNWTNSWGGSVLASKRSDQFAGTTWPGGNTITLTEGVPYYIQAVHEAKPSWTADFGVTYTMAGAPAPANNATPSLTGNVLEAPSLGGATISIIAQPQDATASPGSITTFSVNARALFLADATGGVGPPLAYQWQSAAPGSSIFTNIPSATDPTFTRTALTSADNGAQFQVVIGACGTVVTSTVATLTINGLAASPVAVLTYHFDNGRTGQNTNEAILTPANVNPTSFGLLFSHALDGNVFAQPLLLTNVAIPNKGTHNVLYLVTEHDSVYAFDADNNIGENAEPLWQTNFLNPSEGITNISAAIFSPQATVGPEIGITSTPVIDPSSGTLYAVAYTMEIANGSTNFIHRLHALDVATGAEKPGSPIEIICTNYPGTGAQASDNDGHGHLVWNGATVFNRPALLLDHGVVYVCMGSHLDAWPGHGWVFAFQTNSLNLLGVFNTTPNGHQGGLWMAGDGPAADSEGNIYLMTANGSFSTNYTNIGSYNLSESFVKLALTNGMLAAMDYFTPSNQALLSDTDTDLGMGGISLLPDAAGGASHRRLIMGGGKEGVLYLVDRDNMGHYNSANNSQIVQQLVTVPPYYGSGSPGIIVPSYFNNHIYYIDQLPDFLKEFSISNAQITPKPASSASAVAYSAGPSVVSALGTNNGIVWIVFDNNYGSSGPEVLYAYDANNLGHELYDTTMAGARDTAPPADKHTSFIVANGKVYIAGQYKFSVYGNGTFVAPPLITPNGGAFTNSTVVSITDATIGASLYYTLDGSTPTTNSLLYNGPISLTNSVTLTVFAARTGAVSSSASSATFVDTSSAGNGTGLLGSYYSDVAASNVLVYSSPSTFSRVDSMVDFDWGFTTPASSIDTSSNFAVRWTGMVQPQYNETYTFDLLADDVVRLSINGQTLFTQGANAVPPTTWSGSIALQAQQFYNIEIDYYKYWNYRYVPAEVELSWSSPSTPNEIVPQSQLYPETNAPPSVTLTAPLANSSYSGSASVTLQAQADDQYNAIAAVEFFANGALLATVTNAPFDFTATGLTNGSCILTAVAMDTTGLTATSAPVNITVTPGSGQPYGLATNGTLAPFLNQTMPGSITGNLPTLLSQTGAYTNMPERAPATGLIPYIPNTPLWSDGATKSRYLALPNSSGPVPADQITFAPTGQWSFPAGTIFVKNFDLIVNQTNPAIPLRRLETRLLVRDTNGAVYGVTYKWLPDNSDAILLTNSLTEAIPITNADGITTQTWYYPSRQDCLTCHTAVAGYVLGVNTRQLNGDELYPATGVTDNQLRTLNRLGALNPAFSETNISNFESLSSITNPVASLTQRMRSYLDANCAQCHQPGGSGPTFDARYDTALTNQNIIGTTAKFPLGYDNVNVVTPQDVWRSAIYLRIDTTNDSIKMPPLARNLIDTNAVAVLTDWINSITADSPAEAPPFIMPFGGTFAGSVMVTIDSPDRDAAIYYTLDGSLPTTNSLEYFGPFELTNSATVSADAYEDGFINSVAPSALFTIVPAGLTVSSVSLSSGLFTLNITGASGSSCILQSSSNLLTWANVQTNAPGSNQFNFTLPLTTNSGPHFYRVAQQP